jgi:hypothetical protein
MSLVREQAAFLGDVRKLLCFAEEQHLVVTGGELERKPEMQALYLKSGASASMDSMHLRRCAIDLNFFAERNGQLELLQTAEALEQMGKFWEALDPRNRWGGRRKALDTAHFERDLGAWPNKATSVLAPLTDAPTSIPSAGDARPPVLLATDTTSVPTGAVPILKRGVTNSAAVTRLQDLLVKLKLLVKANGIYDADTENAVVTFQRNANLVTDGIAGEKTWSMLIASTSDLQREQASRWLGEPDLEAAATELGIELPALKAVYKVESAGKGFIGDRPKILFEGHVFWRLLKQRNLDPVRLSVGNGDILYPKWTRDFYVGGAGEWRRLERAEAIQREAARESASYGLFQILGEHWQRLDYASVDEYVQLMCRHERDQLEAFVRFVTKTLSHGRPLVDLLRAKSWADFALFYNGPRYRENAYDDRLHAAYLQYRGAQ